MGQRILMQVFRAIVPVLLLLALPAVAGAQDDRYPRTVPLATGSIPAASDAWSGQPGESGHPLMRPDAILAAVADFRNCLERMWPDAGAGCRQSSRTK